MTAITEHTLAQLDALVSAIRAAEDAVGTVGADFIDPDDDPHHETCERCALWSVRNALKAAKSAARGVRESARRALRDPCVTVEEAAHAEALHGNGHGERS